VLTEHGISCIALQASQDSALLGVGHHDGTVTLTRIGAAWDENEPSLLWRAELHGGPVTSIMLGPEDQVITGSTDRSLRVTPVEGPGAPERPAQLLQLTLRCRGIHFDGVRTEREQEKLRRYSAASGRAARLAARSIDGRAHRYRAALSCRRPGAQARRPMCSISRDPGARSARSAPPSRPTPSSPSAHTAPGHSTTPD
jgi:hypothetical protein